VKKPKTYHASYEGMGTCVEATIYHGIKLVMVISSIDPKQNKKTIAAVKAVLAALNSAPSAGGNDG